MVPLIIMGVLVLAVVGWWVGIYNAMVQAQEEIASRFADVDVQLMRRADLIPNLVNTVKGYAAHEEKIFTEVAAARSRLLAATTPGEKMAANDQLTGALGRLLAIAENYPALKANGLLSPAEREALAAKLRRFEERGLGQMVVLTVPSLEGEPIERFGMRVAETWKPGSKRSDNGLILIIARDDRALRLEVGMGWRG